MLQVTGTDQEIVRQISEAGIDCDRVILTSSPLQFSNDGIIVAEHADCSFLQFSLGRVKSPVDERVMLNYKAQKTNFQGVVLNNFLPEYMDSYLGEIPKKRNKFRLIIKKILNREMSWN